MTMPAVPPYSSTTIAIWYPFERSSATSASRCTVSGTRSGSVLSAPTGTSRRFSRGTDTAAFTCTTPVMSSRSSS